MQKINNLFCGNAQAGRMPAHARLANTTLRARFLQFVAIPGAGQGRFAKLSAWPI
jgi:hypothetical protein